MNKFDDAFKKALNQPQLPPSTSWETITDALDEKKKKRRILPIFYWISGISASFLLLTIIYPLILSTPKKVSISKHKQPTPSEKKGNQSLVNQHINKENDSSSTHLLPENSGKGETRQKIESLENNAIITTNYGDETKQNHDLLNQEFSEQHTLARKPFDNLNKDGKKALIQNEIDRTILELAHTEKTPILKDILTNEEKEISVLLKDKKDDEIIIAKESSEKIAISSFVTPLQFISNASLLSNEMKDNTKTNAITIAYGAKVNIPLNDRISLRAGVSVMNASQQTKNVPITLQTMSQYASIGTLKSPSYNIDYEPTIHVASLKHSMPEAMVKSHTNKLDQRMQYIEIPLEIEYRLMKQNQFKIAATFGGSSLFLTENSLHLTENNSTTLIGEANNLNKVSYSGNLGLKMDYQLGKQTSLNLEPGLKYLLNPVTNIEQKQPLLFGVTFGISVKLKK